MERRQEMRAADIANHEGSALLGLGQELYSSLENALQILCAGKVVNNGVEKHQVRVVMHLLW
eukprot:399019-Prymnesium_polylepis.1